MRNYINRELQEELLKTKQGCIHLIASNVFGIVFSLLFATLVIAFVLWPSYDIIFILFGVIALGISLYLVIASSFTLYKAIKALKSFKGKETPLTHVGAQDRNNKDEEYSSCPKCGYRGNKEEMLCPICGSELK